VKTVIAVVLACLAGFSALTSAAQQPSAMAADPCAWRPPTTGSTVRVRSAGDLRAAVAKAQRGTTILIDRGEYHLDRTLYLRTPELVLRGATGNAADVVLRGDGMQERQVGVAVSIDESDIAVADLTIRDVGYHGIQVRGENGVSRVMIQNVRVFDTGQQLLKGSTDGARHSDGVVVACSSFGYAEHAPSNYTNGVDVLGGTNWVVRDSRFERIRGIESEKFASGPAILFWGNASGTQVERNVVVDCFRGIAFGLGPGVAGKFARDGEREIDHQGGRIRNNVVVNLNPWADEGIEVSSAGDVLIDRNTVVTGGTLPWAISLRFPRTKASVRNNLTSKPPMRRNGAGAELIGNVSGAGTDWFVNVGSADVRLVKPELAPDAGAFSDSSR
jgi:hypothetical protein